MVSPSLAVFDRLQLYSTLTQTPIQACLDEAVSSWLETTAAARLENWREKFSSAPVVRFPDRPTERPLLLAAARP